MANLSVIQVPSVNTLKSKSNWGPFLERPGPKSYFEISLKKRPGCSGTKYDPRKVGCVLASNEADEVHFVSLADDFTEQFLKLSYQEMWIKFEDNGYCLSPQILP